MTIRALIVDDEEQIVRTVGDIVESLNHTYDAAGDIETARKRLDSAKYDYLILDMNIPVAPDRLAGRRENGRNFIGTIRGIPGLAQLPIIVVTGQDKGESDFIVSVMRVGGMEFTQYIQKPVDGDKLDKAIRDALAPREKRNAAAPAAVAPKALQPFQAANREMVIYEDRITLCGAEVWRESTQLYTRDALAMLSRKDKGQFVRIRGTKLTKDLKCPASNQIGGHFSRFCKRATEVMQDAGLACGREDIIKNFSGGYYFRDWMRVRVVGSWASPFGIEPADEPREPAGEPDEPANAPTNAPFNDRQQWLLKEIEKGARLTLKDVVAHFRSECNRSTIGRDMKDLRERGALATHPDGYYVRAVPKPSGSRAAR